jgi:hypothetical protein
MSPPGVRTVPTRTATASRTLRRRTCRELLARSASAAAASRWPIVPAAPGRSPRGRAAPAEGGVELLGDRV